MSLEFDLIEIIHSSEFDNDDPSITRKLVMRYLAAGILFPNEVRLAEQMLRKLRPKV